MIDVDTATVVGIDPDTYRITLVVTHAEEPKRPIVVRFPLDSDRDHTVGCGAAFQQVGYYLYSLYEDHGHYPYVYLESPVLGATRNVSGTIAQAQIGGAIIAAAIEYGCKVTLVNNQSWKKRICGSGNINKEEVANRMKDIWPELWKDARRHPVKPYDYDQNALDAGAINLFGRGNLELKARIIKRRSAKRLVAV